MFFIGPAYMSASVGIYGQMLLDLHLEEECLSGGGLLAGGIDAMLEVVGCESGRSVLTPRTPEQMDSMVGEGMHSPVVLVA